MFTQLRPILFVEDLTAEVDFYQKLGFQILFQMPDFVGLVHGEPILFGLQRRSGAKFGSDQPLTWQIATDDINSVFLCCQQANFNILQEPEQQNWGEWTMSVLSPNGYRVVFEGTKK